MSKTITKRSEDFSEWYQDIVKVADLAENSAVRGCMVIKPWGYALWENIQKILDEMIKETGHQNVYFPLLVPVKFLEKEAKHVEGFAKECAIVTHYRLEADENGKLIPSKNSELAEPYVIRPTSEAIIGEAMSDWVQSYKDLPILINQWCNVMRWEMRTRLFLRTSEFLWQEGHTVHATKEEAVAETMKMLQVYVDLLRNYLAIPVIAGEKTPGERFPGADNTYTIEAMMQDGKALQGGTSHFLGQNFSKAYEIKFLDKTQQLQHAWTTSWGVTTRLIGALTMVHSDDDGLVLPPKIAPDQIRIIPIIKNEDDKEMILDYCKQLQKELKAQTYAGVPIRAKVDASLKEPADKFWEAVKQGVPLRLEIGKRDIEGGTLALSMRHKPHKERVKITKEELIDKIPEFLDNIQQTLLQNAIQFRDCNTHVVNSVDELKQQFTAEKGLQGFAICYFDADCEQDQQIAETLKALKITPRCFPVDGQNGSGKCIFSGKSTDRKVIFAKAY